jgi:hypothetical protein
MGVGGSGLDSRSTGVDCGHLIAKGAAEEHASRISVQYPIVNRLRTCAGFSASSTTATA